MICTLFTGQPVRRVFFMKYTYEYKIECIDLYRQGIYPSTPEGLSDTEFKKTIRKWARWEEAHGPEILKHKRFNKVWDVEEKLELVLKVITGNSIMSVPAKQV